MKFDSIDSLKAEGFLGFINLRSLSLCCSNVPNERGVYIVLYFGRNCPEFVPQGVGGLFKGKDPNKPVSELEKRWIPGVIAIYIGQAGGMIKGKWSEQTLNNRISTYIKFGQKQPVPHWGGRYIWQIRNYQDLVLCWKPLPNKVKDAKQIENQMIQEFKSIYGKRPFANLRD